MYGLGDDAEVSYARLLAQLHPDDCERTERAVARSLEERADYRIEHRVVRPDGAERWLSVLGRPYCDAAGGVRRMLGVAMDVTEQKALLGREQAARAEAQAATQAKDEFLAVLSHELRTPLQAMLGWTHMLRAPGLDAERTCKALETIERNVMAQERLIEDLLDVSRIVAGKLRLASQPVELADVLTSALESLGAEAGAKSIRVEAMIAASAVVLGDRDRLRQVVANLLTNAVKFTPRGGRIAVRLLREGPVAKVVVEDSGCGISAAFLPHVFERFRQAESAYARPHGGLGLGLAIVFHIVALHGGTVRAKSPGEGLGATFTITLPLVGAATAERGDASPARPEGRFAIEGVRVLVVDDDTDARELFEVALRASGAEVRSVGSAAAALVELDSFAAHLLVSDIGMPGEDGYALLRRLRAREPPGGAHLPAIALTAFAGPTDRAQAIDAGFEVHLAKPVTPSALVEEVAKLAGRSRRALSAAG
jgi:signal transduction histidine kinase/CheY-like chemotaxis protein